MMASLRPRITIRSIALARSIVITASSPHKPLSQNFTHFVSIPLTQPQIVSGYSQLRSSILASSFPGVETRMFTRPERLHLTVLMLDLSSESLQTKAQSAFLACREKLSGLLGGQPLRLAIRGLEFIPLSRKDQRLARVVFLDVGEPEQKALLRKVCDTVIKAMLAGEILGPGCLSHIVQNEGVYYPEKLHLTVMNCSYSPRMRRQQQGQRTGLDPEPILHKYAKSDLGTAEVDSLHLSTRFRFDPGTGFYSNLCTMSLL